MKNTIVNTKLIFAAMMTALVSGHVPMVNAETEKEVLYWVAPMDQNYRRDKPGKSPMGMDLIPVYADAAEGNGVVSIDPQVVQNLGVRTTAAEAAIPLRRSSRYRHKK